MYTEGFLEWHLSERDFRQCNIMRVLNKINTASGNIPEMRTLGVKI